jgi:hypothetical protein
LGSLILRPAARSVLFAEPTYRKDWSMKRLVATTVALAFGIALLSAPTVALSKPGNSCNPPAGHGRSGCHRVTAASKTKKKAVKKPVAPKATVKKAAPKRAATKPAAAVAPAVVVPQPTTAVVTTPAAPATDVAIAAPVRAEPAVVTPPAPAPQPWWVALWHLITG